MNADVLCCIRVCLRLSAVKIQACVREYFHRASCDVKAFNDYHVAQCLNYLKATGLKVCLLINFGSPPVEVKRLVNQF